MIALALKAPSLAEGVWGWVLLQDFVFARLATLDFAFAISTLLESAFAKSAMLESFVAFFVVDCHALRCNARNDKVAFFEEAGDLDISKDTHPLTPLQGRGNKRFATLQWIGILDCHAVQARLAMTAMLVILSKRNERSI